MVSSWAASKKPIPWFARPERDRIPGMIIRSINCVFYHPCRRQFLTLAVWKRYAERKPQLDPVLSDRLPPNRTHVQWASLSSAQPASIRDWAHVPPHPLESRYSSIYRHAAPTVHLWSRHLAMHFLANQHLSGYRCSLTVVGDFMIER